MPKPTNTELVQGILRKEYEMDDSIKKLLITKNQPLVDRLDELTAKVKVIFAITYAKPS